MIGLAVLLDPAAEYSLRSLQVEPALHLLAPIFMFVVLKAPPLQSATVLFAGIELKRVIAFSIVRRGLAMSVPVLASFPI
jgi:hypothetical protein